MWQGFTGWHALIILVVILLLFGAPKLPALAKSLGQSMKILKNEVRTDKDDSVEGVEPTDAAGTAGPAGTTSAAGTVSSTEETPAAKRTDSGQAV
ncbi:twin-arginine translocase TatA/TatE family subunit [Agromyces tardus]|jgi:sec-independent protein translocase protein TatA|uniref:Sec-independent protein translocase protein TatA n=1 Tax=Agromyces tardus TaxID=2583849 RepID=A0A3M8AAI0_9MICO|nr:twin-arginine translocase TatA/TatE family subunit [Agromyces tardus]RNB47587.1 twin-arginine translocase TatA/TatE family subunit [Agromyces tardus]